MMKPSSRKTARKSPARKTSVARKRVQTQKKKPAGLSDVVEELSKSNKRLKREISSRRRTEIRLAREQSLLHILMDNIPDTIFFKDRKSRFLAINKACAKKFGFKDPGEAVGKTDFDIFTQEHARQAFKDEQKVIRTGKPIISKEEKETWPGRGDTWVSTTRMPLRDRTGHIIGTFGLARDITVVRHYREKLREANKLLEKRVEERTKDYRDAMEGLQERLEQLDFLTHATSRLAQFINLSDLFSAIAEAFVSRFSKAHVCICTRDTSGYRCAYTSDALKPSAAQESAVKAVLAIAAKRPRSPLIYPDWTGSTELSGHAWNNVRGLPCLVVVPLPAESEILGFVLIFTESSFTSRFEKEKPLLATLASHAAICQSNAEYYREVGLKARLEGELEAARNIQQSFMPKHKPAIPHVDVEGMYQPAYDVSGDYLDYFKGANGTWVLVVADVCGKGIPAALLMTILRSTFRTEAQKFCSARDLVCAVDASMKRNLDERSFVTAICLVIDADGKKMSYVRAGHPKLVHIKAGRQAPVQVECNGLALGLVRDEKTFDSMIEEIAIPLSPGDRFLVYTDGLTEAMDSAMKEYGIERLTKLLRTRKDAAPKELLGAILDDVTVYKNGTPFHDDLTMLALAVT